MDIANKLLRCQRNRRYSAIVLELRANFDKLIFAVVNAWNKKLLTIMLALVKLKYLQHDNNFGWFKAQKSGNGTSGCRSDKKK